MTVNPLLGDNYRYDEGSGRFINETHRRIGEVIAEYDPELRLVWIDPQDRVDADDKPFAIVHFHPDGQTQFISFWREDQVDERLIEHLFENDFRKHHPKEIFDRMEARRDAEKLLEEKRIQEKYDEKLDMFLSLIKSPLHTFKHDSRKWRN
jgi:hypothetical protein